MKTEREIHEEAQRLEQLGRQQWLERRQVERRVGPGVESTRVLLNFPPTQATSYGGEDGELVRTRRTWRWIEVGLAGAAPEYFLMQEWAERSATGGYDDHPEAFVETSDTAVEEVLREGYADVEAESLAERLAPIVARLEEVGFCDRMRSAIEEVEAAIGADELSPAVRLRTRADMIAFLEGRMRPSDFISEVIERKYEREAVRETVAESIGERLATE